MMKTPNIFKFIKVFMINGIIFSLIQNPFINEAIAQDSGVLGMIQGVTQAANNAGNAYLQQKLATTQATLMANQKNTIMSSLGPSCVNTTTKAPCYLTQANYFPQCMLTNSIATMPVGVCPVGANPDPNAINSMINYQTLSTEWKNYYDKMLNKAANGTVNTGLKCIENAQKNFDDQLLKMINSLTELQSKLNQDKQAFAANNKKLLADMDTANDELFGGGKNNLNIKTKDFSKYFSQSCQSVIGKDGLKNGSSTGLNGILQGIIPINKSASDYSVNKGAIEKEIRDAADKMTASIQTGGISDFLNTSAGVENYPSINAVIQKQAAELKIAKDRITREVKDLGYEIPVMDQKFDADMGTFLTTATDTFKKKYISDCVTGADKGVAIPLETILKGLKQQRTDTGTAVIGYQAAIKEILSSNDSFDKKLIKIKDLENPNSPNYYPGITYTYKDTTGSNVTDTPFAILSKMAATCENRYATDDNNNANGVTFKKKVERGRAALQELKNINSNFASKLNSAITAKILNCDGATPKSGSEYCNEDTMKSSGPNFCMSQANKCANDIQGCYAEANQQIQVRKTKMENLAKAYNANVMTMVANTNALYEKQKNAVATITNLIQARFPGSNIEIPKDMFVSTPEMSKDAYGVDMLGNGKMETFLDGPNSMPAKLDLLKQVFQKQRESATKTINDYVEKQEEAMNKQKSRWEDMEKTCKASVEASQMALNKARNDKAKEIAERTKKIKTYCRKFNGIATSTNPNGACGKAKELSDTVDQIADYIRPQALKLTQDYNETCDSANNETNSNPEKCSFLEKEEKQLCLQSVQQQLNKNKTGSKVADKAPKLEKLCNSGGKASDQQLFKNVAKYFSEKDKEVLKAETDVATIIKKANDGDFSENNFFSGLNDLVDSSKKDGSLCQKLTDKSNTIESDIKKKEDEIAAVKPPTESADIIQAKKDLDTAQKSTPPVQSKIDELTKKINDAQTAANDAVKKDKEPLENALKGLKDSRQAMKDAIADALGSLLEIQNNEPDPTSGRSILAERRKIGERMNTQCENLSNSEVAKNPAFDVNSASADFVRSLGSSQ